MSPIGLLFLISFCSSLPYDQIFYHRTLRNHHQYQFEYEAEDGSKRQEIGTLIYRDNESEPILYIKGMYSYFGSDGREYIVYYEADDKGTRNEGDIVPPFIKKKN